MEQLPKIVGQRLQAVSRAEAHPDANLLTAFAEKSLLPREQTQILEHLAACSECREVVAQAQPEENLQHVAAAAVPVITGRRAPTGQLRTSPWRELVSSFGPADQCGRRPHTTTAHLGRSATRRWGPR